MTSAADGPLCHVLPLQLANRLFGVEVVAADGQAPVWQADVRFFKLLKGGRAKAFFYLDPYSRWAVGLGGGAAAGCLASALA